MGAGTRRAGRLGLAALAVGAGLALTGSATAAPPSEPCPRPLPTVLPPHDVKVQIGEGHPSPVVVLKRGQSVLLTAMNTCERVYFVTGLARPGTQAGKVLREERSLPSRPGLPGTTYALYRAIAPGRAVLKATGGPECLPLCRIAPTPYPVTVLVR